jgi:putative transposase
LVWPEHIDITSLDKSGIRLRIKLRRTGITHRCHKREFLLKFAKDRHRWLQWLYQARRRYGLTILNYTVTSNHIHLIVHDDSSGQQIPQSIQLVAGRTGQEYNQRKKRKGACWEDRYHATVIEKGGHLLRCIVYIDMNMVRAGVVDHPRDWVHGGYVEIQIPRRKCILIDYEKLCHLAGYSDFQRFQKAHRKWVNAALSKAEPFRETQWTEAIAVGDESFIRFVKRQMQALAIGRRVRPTETGCELREPSAPYNCDFDGKKIDIERKNTCFRREYIMKSGG